jgi:hypothetical protein
MLSLASGAGTALAVSLVMKMQDVLRGLAATLIVGSTATLAACGPALGNDPRIDDTIDDHTLAATAARPVAWAYYVCGNSLYYKPPGGKFGSPIKSPAHARVPYGVITPSGDIVMKQELTESVTVDLTPGFEFARIGVPEKLHTYIRFQPLMKNDFYPQALMYDVLLRYGDGPLAPIALATHVERAPMTEFSHLGASLAFPVPHANELGKVFIGTSCGPDPAHPSATPPPVAKKPNI